MSERMYYSHDAKMRAQREKAVLIALALSAGGALGALIMLLLAPQNGDKTRQQVMQYVNEALEKGLGKGQEVLEKGQEAARNLTEQALDNANHMRQSVDEQAKSILK